MSRSSLDPESSASANSAIRAFAHIVTSFIYIFNKIRYIPKYIIVKYIEDLTAKKLAQL
jgi:hypothetical protein